MDILAMSPIVLLRGRDCDPSLARSADLPAFTQSLQTTLNDSPRRRGGSVVRGFALLDLGEAFALCLDRGIRVDQKERHGLGRDKQAGRRCTTDTIQNQTIKDVVFAHALFA
ncbi:hypothetical protein DF026_17165 [Burkholderia stagnalis]|nr:hypothetical protein DF026_17165 [Burkholderia stagnalis]